MVVESGPGRIGPVQWQSLSAQVVPAEGEGSALAWTLEIESLVVAGQRGDLRVDCRAGGWRSGRPWCEAGAFAWQANGGSEPLRGRLTAAPGDSGARLDLFDGRVEIDLHWPGADRAGRAEVAFDDFRLGALPTNLLERLGLSVLDGRVDGQATLAAGAMSAELDIGELAFDRPDGSIAAAAVTARIELEARRPDGSDGFAFDLELSQSGGEWLAGALYLPPPEQPLEVAASGRFDPGVGLTVERFALADGEALELDGTLRAAITEEGWALQRLRVRGLDARFPGAWNRWAEGPAASLGLAEVETEGRLRGRAEWVNGGEATLALELDGVSVRDAGERFALRGLDGRLQRSRDRVSAELDFSSLSLLRLPFGPGRVAVSGTPSDWGLSEPLAVPLLDGAVVIDRLEVSDAERADRRLRLDARIEPLDLTALTRTLGWPEFGGQLSGRFPGVRLEGRTVAFTGGIEIEAFSGRVELDELVVERPFGTLPALSAQVEFDRLDLAEVTRAFNFGHMEGQASGWMRDLRLLDWRPVAMDARVFTHEDAGERRISQRAVENLSRLGGGTAAALSAGVLRVFEEFPYRRAGLACRLERNICHMDGVAPREGGGFYIVEGRGIPHLDVVGHRRLVDWPRLVAQLIAATRGG